MIYRIDESSALDGCDTTRFATQLVRVSGPIQGQDENFAALVYALHTGTLDTLLIDHRFADIISEDGNGQRIVDLARFHAVIITTG